jgi:hypothetical protein
MLIRMLKQSKLKDDTYTAQLDGECMSVCDQTATSPHNHTTGAHKVYNILVKV